MELQEEGVKAAVVQESAEELGMFWAEVLFVQWTDFSKWFLQCKTSKRPIKAGARGLSSAYREAEVRLTFFRRSSCSDLCAERSCQREMVCFNLQLLKA